jgi:chaperonin GroEL
MAKEINRGEQARERAVESLANIAGIVGATLGPAGRTILISRLTGGNTISVSHTKDGFNVLNSLEYTDPVHDAVHKLCMQASGNSVLASGDGTTSTLVMASAFAKALHSESNNPQADARKYRKEVHAAVEAIAKEAQNSQESCYKVALTSSNGDQELTDSVLEALGSASAYGTVLVEKNPMQKERYKIDREYGYQAGQGYGYYMPIAMSINETLVNQGEFVLRDSFVIPYNGDLMQFSQIKPFIDAMSGPTGNKYRLCIVAYEVSQDVASMVAYINRKNPTVKIFLCPTTRTAEINGSFQQLNDIAAFSGAKVVDAASAAHWTFEDVGRAGLIRVNPYKTFLLGKSENNWIIERAEQNKSSAEIAPSQMDRDIINSRNASLTGGCVKIVLGGGLMSDIVERADRADDAIKATQAAMRSGALPGCGVSYIRAGALAEVSPAVADALASIHEQIMENCGQDRWTEYKAGQTVKITADEVSLCDSFLEAGIADSFETIKSVIINGFELGVLVANLGGFSLQADLEGIANSERQIEILRKAGGQ